MNTIAAWLPNEYWTRETSAVLNSAFNVRRFVHHTPPAVDVKLAFFALREEHVDSHMLEGIKFYKDLRIPVVVWDYAYDLNYKLDDIFDANEDVVVYDTAMEIDTFLPFPILNLDFDPIISNEAFNMRAFYTEMIDDEFDVLNEYAIKHSKIVRHKGTSALNMIARLPVTLSMCVQHSTVCLIGKDFADTFFLNYSRVGLYELDWKLKLLENSSKEYKQRIIAQHEFAKLYLNAERFIETLNTNIGD